MSNPTAKKNGSADATGASRLDQIVREAAFLFRDKGFSGTSMSDVARHVGVSKPALYHHFASKEDLFVAVATREPQQAADQMMAIADDAALTASEKLRLFLDLAYENMILSIAGQMMHTIAETSAQFPDIARRFRDGFIAGQTDALTKIIDDGVASGAFREANKGIICELTFGPPMMLSLTRAMYGQLDDSQKIDLEDAKRHHFEALMRVLG
jgi:AcrR family transcriptional regulator